MTEYNTLADAVSLAERGFRVLQVWGVDQAAGECLCPPTSVTRDDKGQCTSPGKHPKGVAWQRAATNIREQIEQYDWTNTNVGVLTSEHIVIDVDPRNDGDSTFERLSQEHADDWPDTLMFRTGGGGTHAVYKGVASGGILGPGVDIKATGGLIVGQGSRHVNGGVYEIAKDAPIAPAPVWLKTYKQKQRASTDDWQDPLSLDKIEAGTRDNTLMSIAGVYRKRGAPEELLVGILTWYNQLCVDEHGNPDPLPREDLQRIARSAAHYAPDASLINQELDSLRTQKKVAGNIREVVDIINMPAPAYEIERVWPESGVSVMWGKPGSLKSFLAVEWALCSALGEPWHGLHVQKPRRTLYVAAEGVWGMGTRLNALLHARKWLERDLTHLKFHVGAVNILDPAGVSALEEVITDLGIELLVVDTLRKSMTGGDENSTQDVGRLMSQLEQWHNELGCSSLLVHHANKSGGFRGSSAIEGDADAVWQVSRPGHGLQLELKPEKFKDADDDWKLTVTYEAAEAGSLVSSGIEWEDGEPWEGDIEGPTPEPLPEEVPWPSDAFLEEHDAADVGAWYMQRGLSKRKAEEIIYDRHELRSSESSIVRRHRQIIDRRMAEMNERLEQQ